jgi:hypothetical protein
MEMCFTKRNTVVLKIFAKVLFFFEYTKKETAFFKPSLFYFVNELIIHLFPS